LHILYWLDAVSEIESHGLSGSGYQFRNLVLVVYNCTWKLLSDQLKLGYMETFIPNVDLS